MHIRRMTRAATVADITALVEMARAMHAESPHYRRLSFSARKVEALTRRVLTSAPPPAAAGSIFVAEKEREVIGMIAGFVTEHFFSYDKLASDYALYVKPERRGGLAAVRLIKAFEHWAIAQGAIDIIPGTSTMINAEGTRDLYRALGYDHYGYSMIKDVRKISKRSAG